MVWSPILSYGGVARVCIVRMMVVDHHHPHDTDSRNTLPLSMICGCDIQNKAYFLNSCVKGSLPNVRRSNEVVYLFHDDIFTFKTTN